jgi:hypothetical protein
MGGAELLGRVIGVLLAPLVFLLALVRRARAFHPDGVVYRADVLSTAPATAPLAATAARLAGPALVRLSAAITRGSETPDILGLAIRFGVAGEQDLLLGTFDGFGLRQLSAAKAETDAHDFLHNHYRSVSHYRLDGVGRFTLHARGDSAGGEGARLERLAQATAARKAVFHLEARSVLTDDERSAGPLVDIHLVGLASVPSASLRFSPFRDGLGVRPVGLLAGIRWAAYPPSQLARRLRGA